MPPSPGVLAEEQDHWKPGRSDFRWVQPWTILIGLYLAGLFINLLFGALYQFSADPAHLEADEGEYFHLSGQLLDGIFSLTPRRTLGYPLILAAIRSVSNNFLFVQVVVCALYSLSAPILFLAVRKVTRSLVTAGLCGLALALWAPAIFYGTTLYSETLALPIFLGALCFLPLGSRVLEGRPSERIWEGLLCGILLGLATHVRPMYLLFLPFLLAIVLIEERRFQRAIGRFLTIIAGFLLVIGPWSVYMTARFHHPILVTSNGGETLAGGLTPRLLDNATTRPVFVAGRTTWVGPGKWLSLSENGYLTPRELQLPYDQQDEILRARTIRWIMEHPLDASYLEMRKIAYMWGLYPFAQNGLGQMLLGNLPTIALLLIGIVAFLRLPKSRTSLARFWMLPLFVSAVALISWGSWRFRQPGDVGLLSFCVICAAPYLAARFRRLQAIGISRTRPSDIAVDQQQ
jgi:hypothetical protein